MDGQADAVLLARKAGPVNKSDPAERGSRGMRRSRLSRWPRRDALACGGSGRKPRFVVRTLLLVLALALLTTTVVPGAEILPRGSGRQESEHPGRAPLSSGFSPGGFAPDESTADLAATLGTDAGRLRPARHAWDRLAQTPVVRRILDIGGWIASFLRFLWTIPKALLQGDSQAMIEALGDLLARTSSESSAEQPAREIEIPASVPESGLLPSTTDDSSNRARETDGPAGGAAPASSSGAPPSSSGSGLPAAK